MVFRRDSKVDAFQRQISALRHQLGGENEDAAMPDHDLPRSIGREGSYLSEYPEFTSIGSDQRFCCPRTRRYDGLETGRFGPFADSGN